MFTKEQLIAQGLTEAQADAIIKMHKDAIDGNYIPKATFEAERDKVKNLNTEVENRDKQIKELGTFKGTAEDLQKKVTDLEAANKAAKDEFDAKLLKLNQESAVKADIIGQVVDVDDVLPKLDFTKIKFNDGKIESGLTEQLDELKKTKPHYFKTEQKSGNPVGWIFGKTPTDGNDKTPPAESKEALFGKQLAESQLGGAGVAKKAQDYYFK